MSEEVKTYLYISVNACGDSRDSKYLALTKEKVTYPIVDR